MCFYYALLSPEVDISIFHNHTHIIYVYIHILYTLTFFFFNLNLLSVLLNVSRVCAVGGERS